MAGIFSNDWFTKGSGSDGWLKKKQQEFEDEQQQAANLAKLKGADPSNDTPQQKPQGNIFQKVIGGTGNFIKNAAVDLKDTTVDTAKGLTAMVESPFKEAAANHAIDQANDVGKQVSKLTANWSEQDYQDPKKKAQLDALQKQRNDFLTQAQKHIAGDKINEFNAKKLAAESAETVINVGTLGIGSIPKQLAKQGIKTFGKEAVEQMIKTGGVDATKAIIEHQATREAARVAAEQAAKEAALTGGKKVAATAGKDALIGGGFGATSTVAQNPDASAEDIAKGTAMGAGLGAAFPVVGSVLKKGFTKLVGTAKHTPIEPAVGDVADTTPKNPDGSVDINKMLNDAAKTAQDKHEQGFLSKIAGVVGQHTNPLGFAREIDQKTADRLGVDYKNLPADQSLEHLIQSKANVDNIVNTLAREKTSTGDTFQQLAKKYAGDSPAAKEFNNYTLAKYDLDRRAAETGGGARTEILGGQKTEDLQKFVDDYEKRNPSAVKDLQTKNAFYQHAAQELHKGGLISDKELNDIVSSSDVATPFNRIFADAEAVDGPQMPGRRTGSIAKQSVIKGIKGGTEPVDASLDVVLERVHKAVGQRIDNNIANRLRDAAEHGDVVGRVFQEAGAKEAKAAARAERIQTNKSIRILTKKMGISQKQANKLATEISNLNKQGLGAYLKRENEDTLRGKLVEPGLKQSPNEVRSVIGDLISKTPKEIAMIQKKIATREPKLAEKLNRVIEHKQLIDSKKLAVEDLKDMEVGLTREGTTGKAYINGVQDGQTFRVELPPKVINRLDKLSRSEVNTALKVVGAINQAFRIAWVGALAPGFAVKSALWDTMMGVINSPDGWKTLAPKAVKSSFKALTESDEFLQKLRKSGASTVGSSQLGIHTKISAESLAATRNLFSRVKFGAKNPQATLDSLDVFGGKLASLTRTRVARAAYDRMIKEGASEEEALSSAAYYYNNVMPDFATMSPLVRQINTIIPFTNASIAGTRAMAQAFKRAPGATAAKMVGLGVMPATAVAAYSLSSESGRQFYQDMHDAGNDDVLNNNLIVVLPGAHKDDKTGIWSGIIKIPMTPEFRQVNSQVWRNVEGLKGGRGDNGQQAAMDLFDTITGGVRTLSNPLVDMKTILDGKDPRTGKQLVGDNLKDLPLDQQAYSTTSAAGTDLAKVLHTSPIQADKILGQFGTAGAALKSGNTLDAVSGNAKDTYTGAYGQKISNAFYDTYSPLKSQRQNVSKEVTNLVVQGKINEAKRKANEFNDSLTGKFSDFDKKYGKSDAYNKDWNDMMNSLFISTSDNAFKARATAK